MKKRNLKKGFTIVELVIVIAVIAILSAVLIPTFGSVVANAEKAALKADAKAIYTEYVAWASENGKDVAETVYVAFEEEDGTEYYEVKSGVLVDTTADELPQGATQVVVEEAVEACAEGCTEHTDGNHLEAKDAVKLNVWVPAA